MSTDSLTAMRYCLFFILPALVLASCGPTTVAPTATLPTTMPSPSPTAQPSATPTASPTATPTPSPSAQPMATPLPTPTFAPMPTLVPTVDPTVLPDLLSTAFTVREEEGVGGHPLRRVTGWEYGIGAQDCSYRWLDEEHLFLPAFAGEENRGIEQWTLPVVVNLSSGATWLPQTQRTVWCCDQPRWSEVLQALITVHKRDVLFLDPEGQVIRRYPGAGFFDISPSGRRLVIGDVWYDLETGRAVTLEWAGRPAWSANAARRASERAAGLGPKGPLAWSSDETRLFSCCFLYVDVNNPDQSGPVNPGYLEPVGRGVPGCGGGVSSYWVLHDRFVVLWWDFFTTAEGDMAQRVHSPFIDPIAQSYTDLCALAGVPPEKPCGWAFWGDIAPDKNHILLQFEGNLYVVGPEITTVHPLPVGSNGFPTWSPDGQFVLFGWNLDQARRGEYWLFSMAGGSFDPVAMTPIPTPTWSPQGKYLAFFQDEHTLAVMDPQTMVVSTTALPGPFVHILWKPQGDGLTAFSEDARTLTVLDLEPWTATPISLPRPLAQVLWQPQGNGLVIQADDGSLWWLPGLAASLVEPLTPPLPGVRELQWSPSGRSLSFISGADVYVVPISK